MAKGSAFDSDLHIPLQIKQQRSANPPRCIGVDHCLCCSHALHCTRSHTHACRCPKMYAGIGSPFPFPSSFPGTRAASRVEGVTSARHETRASITPRKREERGRKQGLDRHDDLQSSKEGSGYSDTEQTSWPRSLPFARLAIRHVELPLRSLFQEGGGSTITFDVLYLSNDALLPCKH
jgi:hypothetical protein